MLVQGVDITLNSARKERDILADDSLFQNICISEKLQVEDS